jgi:hypothetical protein
VNNTIKIVAAMVVIFAVLLPFTSKSPDALQTLEATPGVGQQAPVWGGLMAGYSVGSVGDSYVSTLLAGVFGLLMVFAVAFGLGAAVAPKKKHESVNQV